MTERTGLLPGHVTEEDLKAYLEELREVRQVAPSTFVQHVAALRFFYAHVVVRDFPILREAKARRRRVLPDILTVAEVQAVLHAVRMPQLFALCATLYACGLRRSEGLALAAEDIDRGRGLLHVRDGKGGSDRFVPIPPRLQGILDAHLQREGIASGPAFRSRIIPGRTVGPETAGRALREAAGAAGLAKSVHPHSCRDRLCPMCRGPEAHAWLQARQAEVLPVRYFHAIVTVPTVYSRAVRDHPQVLAGQLMEAVAEALQEVAGGPHGPGGELGLLAVLHTWGRNLGWHAHVHCLVPGVALHADGTFEPLRTRFLVPIGAFRKVFRAILTRRFRAALPGFDPPGRVWRTSWNAKIRPCDEGPGTVLRYLTRYVRSGPLHESQIRQADEVQVAFRYLDHRSRTLQVWHGTPAAFVAR